MSKIVDIKEEKTFDIPVVLFIFRRIDTVKLIFEVFQKIKPTKLYIFADGPRDDNDVEAKQCLNVRKFVDSSINWECEVHKNYAISNKGCAPNICDGLDSVFSKENSAIIFEDDAVPTVDFFYYCKELLEKYENDKRIQYIAGFNGVGDDDPIIADYDFCRFAPKSGAIALWADRWNECDFHMKNWPINKRIKRFKNYFFYKELYHEYLQIFDDSFKNVNQGWDYQMDHDMLDKNQFAIVPKGNLVKSYGYTAGAFHPTKEKEGMRFASYMDYTKHTFTFPLKDPLLFECNNEHDRLRQRSLLDIKGNYFERHIYYSYRFIKDLAYRYLPLKVWNIIKMLCKRKSSNV